MSDRQIIVRHPVWVCGPAVVKDGWIVLTEPREVPMPWGGRHDAPWPERIGTTAVALARVRTPGEAAAFAEQFGLLRCGPGAPEFRERFVDWQREIATLSGLIDDYIAVWPVVTTDDLSVNILESEYLPIANAAHTVLHANLQHVGAGVRLYIEDAQLGWKVELAPRDLLATVYSEMAAMMADGKELRYCEDCARAFLVEDPRQRFCDGSCNYRSRHRRMIEKRQRESVAGLAAP